MATVQFIGPDELDFRSVTDIDPTVDPELAQGILFRAFCPGDGGAMQLVEVKCEPHFTSTAHAHREGEILYVNSGELHFGSRVCPVGSVVVIPAMTLYGFTAGPEGGSFLNFRARGDYSYFTKEEVVEELRRSRAGAGPV